MTLNDFRKINIAWDRATKKIYENVRVASSDESGRKLVVQVINGGQVEDLTGVVLNLYWEHQRNKTKGLDKFKVIDAKKGIFELYFTTGMLSNIGKLDAHLHLIDTTGAVTSEPFSVSVFDGVDTEAVQSSDSFSTLTDALNRVIEIELHEDERKQNEVNRVNAEQEREQAEDTRSQSEIERVSNEESRVLDEEARQSEEQARQSNETERQSAETDRQSNEQTRQSNETGRVSAETDRQTTFDNLVTDLEGLEEEYAPRLIEVERKTNNQVYTVDTENNTDFQNDVTKNGHHFIYFTEVEEW